MVSVFMVVQSFVYFEDVESAVSDRLLPVYQITWRFIQKGSNPIGLVFKYWIVFQ
jgi:hypothetical protein